MLCVAGHIDEEVPITVVLLVTQLVLMAMVDPTGKLRHWFSFIMP